jgi:hypothetical protein
VSDPDARVATVYRLMDRVEHRASGVRPIKSSNGPIDA